MIGVFCLWRAAERMKRNRSLLLQLLVSPRRMPVSLVTSLELQSYPLPVDTFIDNVLSQL